MVVYVEGASKRDFSPRYIQIWDGLATLNDYIRKDYTIDGFATAQSSSGDTTFIVGGGFINSSALDWYWDEATVEFSTGEPIYEEDAFRGLDGQYWDTRTYPRLLSEDENAHLNVAIDVGKTYPEGNDCLMWVAQIVSVETLCKNVVDNITVSTDGKGQSATNNEKISHDINGKIVGIPKPTDTKIYICEGSPVWFKVIDNSVSASDPSGPELFFDLDPFAPAPNCSADPDSPVTYCTIDSFENEITYSVTSADGKDKDTITLIPVR